MTDDVRAFPSKPKPIAPPRLIIKFFLKHGTVVDWPMPVNSPITFGGIIAGIRASGCFIADDLYIPLDEIACVGFGPAAARVAHPTQYGGNTAH